LTLDLVSGSIASSNHSNGSIGDTSSVILGEPTALAQRLESLDNVGPGGSAIGLDIDPEVKSLARRRVEDSVMGGSRHER
jgi:hypothetical protein